MKQLIIAPSAGRDLKEIHDYIAKDNPDAASRLLGRLCARFSMLQEHPGMGRQRDELPPGLRCMAEVNYLIIFRLVGEDTLEIARVLHSKRNIQRILKSSGS